MLGGFHKLAALGALLTSAVAPLPAAAAVDCGHLNPQLQRPLDEAEWRRVERQEVVGRLLETEGSPVKEGLAVGVVQAAPDRVFRVVTDNARFADFMPYVEISTVEEAPDGSVINLQRLDLPWPVSNREYKIQIVNTAEPDADPAVWQSAWTHVEGFGNIEESRGAWRVFACDDVALVEYQVLTDPGGRIPNYFKNKATRRSLPRLIEAVRERVGHPIYDLPD